jgi:hypothetical protein
MNRLMATTWKEDDRDTLALFLETVLEGYREGKISRVQAIAAITEAFSQAGLQSGAITAYMQSVIQEYRKAE